MNEIDEFGDIPLDLALSSNQESLAKTLVNHKANVNQTDNRGWTLLHKAVDRSKFLFIHQGFFSLFNIKLNLETSSYETEVYSNLIVVA